MPVVSKIVKILGPVAVLHDATSGPPEIGLQAKTDFNLLLYGHGTVPEFDQNLNQLDTRAAPSEYGDLLDAPHDLNYLTWPWTDQHLGVQGLKLKIGKKYGVGCSETSGKCSGECGHAAEGGGLAESAGSTVTLPSAAGSHGDCSETQPVLKPTGENSGSGSGSDRRIFQGSEGVGFSGDGGPKSLDGQADEVTVLDESHESDSVSGSNSDNMSSIQSVMSVASHVLGTVSFFFSLRVT